MNNPRNNCDRVTVPIVDPVSGAQKTQHVVVGAIV